MTPGRVVHTARMEIRLATPDDALVVAGVHVRSWQVGYRGLLDDDLLDGLVPEERAARYTFGSPDPLAPSTRVAVEGGAIVGFATTAPARDPDRAGAGELCALYVDPDRWHGGVGRSLVASARHHLAAQGFDRAVLWVLTGNERAQRFYRTDGWRPDGAGRRGDVWGAAVDEVRFERTLP